MNLKDQADKLLVVHALSQTNLVFADFVGGIPAPSVAIVDKTIGISIYGNITLVGTKDLLDLDKHKVYATDIYSSRQPEIYHRVNEEKFENILSEKLKSFPELHPSKARIHNLHSLMQMENGFFGNFNPNYFSEPEFLVPFLTDMGMDVSLKYNESKSDFDYLFKSPVFSEWFSKVENSNDSITIPPHVLSLIHELLNDQFPASTNDRKNASNKFQRESLLKNVFEDGKIYLSKLDELSRDFKLFKNPIKSIDTEAILSAYNDIERQSNFSAFNFWMYETFKDTIDNSYYKKISKNGGMNHAPYDLDGIAKMIQKEGLSQNTYCYNNYTSTKSGLIKPFSSFIEIAEASRCIIDKDSFLERTVSITDKIHALGVYLEEKYPTQYNNSYMHVSDFIRDFSKNKNKAIDKHYPTHVFSKDDLKKIMDLIKEVKQGPEMYFESKICRHVDLSEFRYAVLPSDSHPTTLSILEKNGIQPLFYTGDEKEAARALSSIDDVTLGTSKQLQFEIRNKVSFDPK